MTMVPRYLHLPVQVLWFDMEDIAVLLASYSIWMVFSSWYVMPVVAGVPILFMRIKSSRPRGFLQHALYQYGFASLKGYPPPMTERFEE